MEAGGVVEALDRWPGCKRWLPSLYSALLPLPSPRGVVFDPFVGSGAVSLFYLARGYRVVMGDANPRLMGAYAQLQRDARAVVNALSSLAEEHQEAMRRAAGKDHYLTVRTRLNASDPTSLEGAALFLFLLRTCFNGVYRVNRRGECNTPYGDPDLGTDLVRRVELQAVGRLLRKATLRTGDFAETIAPAKKGDVVYLDAPYPADKGKVAFVAYAEKGFTREDQKRVGVVLRELDAKGVRWLLSDAATDASASTYGLWNVRTVGVRRSVSCSETRGEARELLVSNG